MLSKRDQINEVLRAKLDELTERWGGKVTTVEIREIIPPRDVQEAMNRQLSAERNRRAVITESEGTRQATINVAEGEKQSNILRAEGERQSAILRAEGFSQALERIFGAATGIDEKTMALQYLEALKALGRRRRPSSSSRSSSPADRAVHVRAAERRAVRTGGGSGRPVSRSADRPRTPRSAARPAPWPTAPAVGRLRRWCRTSAGSTGGSGGSTGGPGGSTPPTAPPAGPST